MKVLIAALTIALAACSVCAKEYHVSSTDHDGDTGSKSKPLKAMTVAAPFGRLAGILKPAIFTEDFNSEAKPIGRNRQAQSSLPVRHGHELPGWSKLGADMPAHWVEQYPGNWVFMLVANRAAQNVYTQNQGFEANNKGHVYTVSFDAGPAVYAAISQATAAADQIAVELLRPDGTVLKKHLVTPGKWSGRLRLQNHTFTYRGDGSGPLRFRISPVYTSGIRFFGAIDHLQVFASAEEARQAVARRLALAKHRARLLETVTPLQKDWLFQADGIPIGDRVKQEITWSRQLADRLTRKSNAPDLTDQMKALDALEARLESSDHDALVLYLEVRKVKRQITFKNPAVDFSKILLVDNPYPLDRHESMHRQGYMSGPGTGNLLVLEGLNPDSAVRSLLPDDQKGFLWRPDLSLDAKTVVFCMKPPGGKSYHLYEVNSDGTHLKQLTFGDYDDLDPIYLPGGKILFSTTRAHTYVRCGPRHHAFVLARCDGDGKNIYVVSYGNEPDYLPSLMNDGRIIYTRWEYTDKEQKRVQGLWTMNPDGTNVMAFWGNQSVWPDILAEPRAIPNSERIMFTGVGHHMWFSGSIGVIDQRAGMNYPHGISKVTPEIPWPEVGNGSEETSLTEKYHQAGRYSDYKTPYPIGEEDFLVSIKSTNAGHFALYLMDIYGNRELIYAGKNNVWHAIPFKPRKAPPAIVDRVAWPAISAAETLPEKGVLFSANVFEGAPDIPKDKVKYLRVIQSDAKTYSSWVKTYQHQGPEISVTQADSVKRILGTTPVEKDGSVYFKVPAGKSLHFQLIDEQYRCIQTMRSFTGVMPGEVRGCVGCHEGRANTPQMALPRHGAIAVNRGGMDLTAPPWGAEESISYMRFVQPVLDEYCGSCHQGDGDARKKFDLTVRPSKEPWAVSRSADWYFNNCADVSELDTSDPWRNLQTTHSPSPFPEPYVTLVGGGNDWYQPTRKENFNRFGLPISFSGCLIVEGYTERNMDSLSTLPPMSHFSAVSRLLDYATDEKHIKEKIDQMSLRRLIAWIDCNGPYLGDAEIRRLPDPSFRLREDPPVRPRLKTAPLINRFNIRQDGDSEAVVRGSLKRIELGGYLP